MKWLSILERRRRRVALAVAVALGFLIWHGALGAAPANAAKLTTTIYGNMSYPQEYAGTGWGSVTETTPAGLTNCFFPNDYDITSCDAFYGFGWTVELRADAAPGWRFDHWVEGYGDLVRCDAGTADNVCRFTMWLFDAKVGAYFSDDTPPETVLDSAPGSAISATNASFAFHSPDNDPHDPVRFSCNEEALDPPVSSGTFNCDGGTFSWPFGSDGKYRLTITAKDASGNDDPTPAVVTFTADTVAPETNIDSGPTGTVWQRYATFAFSGTDPAGGANGQATPSGVARYQCRLDNGPWTDCPSPVGYDGLSQGAHELDVRAVDAAGNVDATPASRTWTVTTPKCFGSYATKVGTSGNDVLTGTAGPDVIVGLGGNDTISGLGDGDLICGGDGNDTLRGNVGNDRLDGGPGTDVADYSAAPAGVTVDLPTGTASGGDGTDLSLNSIESVLGSTYADTLTGNGYANSILGRSGDDTIKGLGGNDLLVGGPGADRLDGGTGLDAADYRNAKAAVTVNLSISPATASGGDGADPSLTSIETVYGSNYADTLTGSKLAESLYGMAGNDTLTGGGGVDALRGGPGDDTMYARDGLKDTVDGSTGSADKAQVDSGLDAVSGVETLLP